VSVAEFVGLGLSPVFWTRRAHGGDGHSVLVIPGFGAQDRDLIAMHVWLNRMGYRGVAFRSGNRLDCRRLPASVQNRRWRIFVKAK
jgi:hypothetical protein